MELIKISDLNPHPRNGEFFDDIQGDNWTEFLKSIKTSGVIEPVIVSETTRIIVSGHQRVRACKELGINEVPCRIRPYANEDIILKEVLETNLRQRGIGNLNPIKFARCIKELERIYGIEHGGDRKSSRDNPNLKKQKELAENINATQDQIIRYKKLLTLIPELQDLIEIGEMSATVGHKVWAKLPQDVQTQIVEELGTDKIAELTQNQAAELLNRLEEKDTEIENVKTAYDLLQANKHFKTKGAQNELVEELNELKAKQREEYEKSQKRQSELEKELSDKDKEVLKAEKELAKKEKEIENLKKEPAIENATSESEELKKLRKELKKTRAELTEAQIEINRNKEKPVYDLISFKDACQDFFFFSNQYEAMEYRFREMPTNDLEQFIESAEEVMTSMENIINEIGGIINERKE